MRHKHRGYTSVHISISIGRYDDTIKIDTEIFLPTDSRRPRSGVTLGSIRQQMIRRILLENAGGSGANASAVADATVRTWMRAAAELALLIGQGGVHALYERSVHLTRATHPWLPEAEQSGQTDATFSALKAGLEKGEPEDALEAGTAFFIVYTDLLSKLIGEALTMRLVDASWVDVAEQARRENNNG